jgi:hypothetical protein
MNQRGWVMVHRKIEENDLWFAEPFSKGQAWIDILLLANHQKKTVFIRGNEVTIERGQFIHSEETLARRWKWSRGKTRAFLELLANRQMLDNRKSRLCAVRTVLNYDEYQESGQQTRQQNVQQKAIRLDNRPDTNKNGNNEKNEKNDNKNTIAPNDGAVVSQSKPKRSPDELMDLDQFVTYMRQSQSRAVNLIGEWADTIRPKFTTWGQWNTFMRRHLRAAQQLAPFTDDQIADAYDKITTLQAKSDFKPTIETLIKFLT